PVIWHVRDRIENDYLPSAVVRLFRLLSRIIPNYVIANSRATLATLNLPASQKCAAIYSGITIDEPCGANEDRDEAPAATADGEEAAKQLGPTGTRCTIGLVGRISPWKGQHIFLQAARDVHDRFPHTRFQIIGAALFDEKAYEDQLRR